MAILSLIRLYLPEGLSVLFMGLLLWIGFLPSMESPFRIKLEPAEARIILACSLTLGLMVFGFNYLWTIQNRWKVFTAQLFGLFLNVLAIPIIYGCVCWILGESFLQPTNRHGVVGQPLYSLLLAAVAVLTGVVLGDYRLALRQREEARLREAASARLALENLRHQLNPHFLFNSLNNIDSLILRDPDKASAFLLELASIMRYILDEEEWVPLIREKEFLQRYLQLNDRYAEGALTTDWTVSIENPNFKVPSALFLPLVENLIKHRPRIEENRPVQILLHQSGNKLTFQTVNDLPATELTEHNATHRRGIGLDLVQNRLQLLFPDRHRFRILKDSNGFRVELECWNL